jgi:hypothetical protein
VFEPYTERARRSIFFARYEASRLGTLEITAEELLLGILREDKTVEMQLGEGAAEAIRKELEPAATQKVSTSIDLPLTEELKRALAYAAEEAERMNHKLVDSPHLVLGLMRETKSRAARLLRQQGLEIKAYRKVASEHVDRGPQVKSNIEWREPDDPPPTALQPTITELWQLVNNTADQLGGHPDTYGNRQLKRAPWTRKEALGHLIDWAIAHQQWLTAALMESRLKAAGYPDQAAIAVQHYADFPWEEILNLWVSMNRLLIHVLLRVPEAKLDTPCRIGIAEPVSLAKLMEAYLEHCKDLVGQIVARLD